MTNLCFSYAAFALILRLNNGRYPTLELALYALGLGPALTELLLYYLLLLAPGLPPAAYFAILLLVFTAMVWGGKNHLAEAWQEAGAGWARLFKHLTQYSWAKRWEAAAWVLFVGSLMTVLIVWYGLPLFKGSLHGHDILGYGYVGKMILQARSLEPIWVRDFSDRGYYYVTLHMPGVPLLWVWENIVAAFFGITQDLYFRTVGLYYALLIMAVQFLWLVRVSKLLALVGWLVLLSSMPFLWMLGEPHVDSFRIFLLGVSWIFLAYHWKNNDFTSLACFSLFGGLASTAHALCALSTTLAFFFLPLFMTGNLRSRVLRTCQAFFMVMAFGACHYMFDLLWGRHWLLY